MKNFIKFLRLIALFIGIVGVFYKMQDMPDADNIIKSALFIFMISVLFWIVTLIRRGKGAY